MSEENNEEHNSSKTIYNKINSMNYLPDFQSNIFKQSFDSIKISYVLLLGAIIFIYISIFILFGNSNDSNSILNVVLEIIIWAVLILVIGVNLNMNEYDFSTTIKNLFNNKGTEIDVNVEENKDEKQEKEEKEKNKEKEEKNSCSDSDNEVFHIPNNKYTYHESRKICNKYNSRLATYDEIEQSYNSGSNWCSYGWSENQLALFPTQKNLYQKLQKIPGHENDCGRQGVNGGFIKNPHVKFGVNCYGKKPEKTDIDDEYFNQVKNSYSPSLTQDELNKIENEKNKILVAPFNSEKWSLF